MDHQQSQHNVGHTAKDMDKRERGKASSSKHLSEQSSRYVPLSNSRVAIAECSVQETHKQFHGHTSQINSAQRFYSNSNIVSNEAPAYLTDENTRKPCPSGAAEVSDQTLIKSTSKNVETLRTGVIGLGRSTGLSRVPDVELSGSPTLVASVLQSLVTRVRNLEDNQKFLVAIGDDMREGAVASDKTLAEWESILAQYRQLTMAVTASSSKAVKSLVIPVYEGAADACLLGGNLSFYLSCQTRLLQELYKETNRSSSALSRLPEFLSYSFLYFGVFLVDRCELARLMRSVSPEILHNPRVKLALSAVKAVQMCDGIRFIRIYKTCDIRQRTLMNTRLSSMRASAMVALTRAYHTLESSFALSLLGLEGKSDFLHLMKTQSPALAEQNSSSSCEFSFRIVAARTATAT